MDIQRNAFDYNIIICLGHYKCNKFNYSHQVETIGDAYMVVSGLPDPNGDQHAAHIATMSLHVLSGISSYTIPHMAGVLIQIRIGIHTGRLLQMF